MTINEKLKILRKTAGFSQKQLAEKLGVERQMITHYEKSLIPIPKRMEEISKILNFEFKVDNNYFIDNEKFEV